MSNKHNFNANLPTLFVHWHLQLTQEDSKVHEKWLVYWSKSIDTCNPSGSIANSLFLAEHGTASPGRHRWEAGCRVSNFRRHGSFLQLWLLRSPGYTLWWHWAPLLQELLCRRIHRLHLRQWTIPVHGKQAATAKLGHRVGSYFLWFDQPHSS